MNHMEEAGSCGDREKSFRRNHRRRDLSHNPHLKFTLAALFLEAGKARMRVVRGKTIASFLSVKCPGEDAVHAVKVFFPTASAHLSTAFFITVSGLWN
jgi:hypothetical protein